jgi:ABC-type Fe3+/spermidine/putrescine transport system ATPase subunit
VNVIETSGLGRRYGRTWALKDAALAIPGGYVVALVGPNGAGKTTLLHMSVGLTRPTTGQVTVLGSEPAGSPTALDQIAFVAQDAPHHKNLSVADMLHLTPNLNRRWDQQRRVPAEGAGHPAGPQGRHFQFIEGGWLLALSLILIAGTSGWSAAARHDGGGAVQRRLLARDRRACWSFEGADGCCWRRLAAEPIQLPVVMPAGAGFTGFGS